MLKKVFTFGLVVINTFVLAMPTQLNESTNVKHRKHLNSPTSGSKQYSNGNFGNPKLVGTKGQKYYSDEQLSNPKNSPTQGGSKAYSTKTFPIESVSGQKGEKYYTSSELKKGPNRPVYGSKAGSNQVFGYPGKKRKASNDIAKHF